MEFKEYKFGDRKMPEYTVKTKKSIIIFMHESDYNMYMDFINNGLKVVRKKDGSYFFNDGSRFLDNKLHAVRVLTDRKNQQFRNERYFKKYLQAIEEYTESN